MNKQRMHHMAFTKAWEKRKGFGINALQDKVIV
jgi:hypothetical protein